MRHLGDYNFFLFVILLCMEWRKSCSQRCREYKKVKVYAFLSSGPLGISFYNPWPPVGWLVLVGWLVDGVGKLIGRYVLTYQHIVVTHFFELFNGKSCLFTKLSLKLRSLLTVEYIEMLHVNRLTIALDVPSALWAHLEFVYEHLDIWLHSWFYWGVLV